MKRTLFAVLLCLVSNFAFAQEVVSNEKFVKLHSEATIKYSLDELLDSDSFYINEQNEYNVGGRVYLKVPKTVDGLKVLDAKIPKIKDLSARNCNVEIADGQRFVGGELELRLTILPKNEQELDLASAKKCYLEALKINAFMRKISFDVELELAEKLQIEKEINSSSKSKAKKVSASAQ